MAKWKPHYDGKGWTVALKDIFGNILEERGYVSSKEAAQIMADQFNAGY